MSAAPSSVTSADGGKFLTDLSFGYFGKIYLFASSRHAGHYVLFHQPNAKRVLLLKGIDKVL